MSHASENDADQLLREVEKEIAFRKADVDALQQIMGLLIPPDMCKSLDGARRRILEILPGSKYESWNDLRGERGITELLDVIDRGLANVRPRPSRLVVGYLCAYGDDTQVQVRGGSDSSYEHVEELGEHAREEEKRYPASSELAPPVACIDAAQILRKLEKETMERKGDVHALKQIIRLVMPDDMCNMFNVARQRVLAILPGGEYETWNELCGDRSTTELLDFIERGLVNVRRRPSREGLRYLCAYGGDIRVQVHRKDDNSSELLAREELEQLAREEGKGHGTEQCMDADQVRRKLEQETAERKGDVDALQQIVGVLIPPNLRVLLDAGRRLILDEAPGCRYESWRALRGDRSTTELLDVIEQGLIDGNIPYRPPRDALKLACAYGGDVQYENGRIQQDDDCMTVSYDEEQRILDGLRLFVREEIFWMVQEGLRLSGRPV
ncbi:hypothetical protein BJ138DRAFT_1128115 [Hygrophoropsis aurantiaca]|uniref:Uncharacterized protein n=1 Tax=Hygrophoropsis aurantiaca TaxID=72124 RepID=A0ACB8A732_9AGAM|nr:hypothetical protein BJ138DRAFT_1128115 [Hygrophoropsis aurantiaca]